MRAFFLVGMIAGLVWLSLHSSVHGQGGKEKKDQTKDQKTDTPKTGDTKTPTPTAAPAPAPAPAPTTAAKGTAKVVKPEPFIPYLVMGAGVVVILVLVCLPARRE